MKRPSIFSRDYEEQVKKRRKIIILLIIVPIIGLSIFLITDVNGLKNKGISIKNSINNILLNKSKVEKVAEVKEKSEKVVKQQSGSEKSKAPKAEVAAKSKAPAKDGTFLVSLSDGQKLTIAYTTVGAKRSIKGVSNTKDISYDISPSKKSIVMQSTKNQDLFYIDVNNVIKDITKKTHTSSKNEVFSKEQQLKTNPNYLWSITPKFIDEDNIAYVSELPWMNDKATLYLWKVNVKSNTHMQVKPASGTKITFIKRTSKGLETNVDGNIIYVTSAGEVIQ